MTDYEKNVLFRSPLTGEFFFAPRVRVLNKTVRLVVGRHHLNMEDGVRADVNLIDVLDFIADCVMAGMARSGSVYPLKLSPEVLERAFQNTVELLKGQVVVASANGEPDPIAYWRGRAEEAEARIANALA